MFRASVWLEQEEVRPPRPSTVRPGRGHAEQGELFLSSERESLKESDCGFWNVWRLA